jgi:murein DD-endopeptidase MepM/ murein hydrolase activator NlpD
LDDGLGDTVKPEDDCDPGQGKDVHGDCVDCEDIDQVTGECIDCSDGQVRNAGGHCVEPCQKYTGYVLTNKFSGNLVAGNTYNLSHNSNLRNVDGSRATFGCNTQTLNSGSEVVLESTVVVKINVNGKDYNYYNVSQEICDGNMPDQADYDPNKPCSDCNGANPFKGDQKVTPQKYSGIKGGTFGMTRSGGKQMHSGIDIASAYGDPIYAMFDGYTTAPSNERGVAGYVVAFTSTINGNQVTVNYCHLQKDKRSSGQQVKAGDIIGYQGDSGNLKKAIKDGCCDSHVHIGIRENGIRINPLNYMKYNLNMQTGKLTENDDCN